MVRLSPRVIVAAAVLLLLAAVPLLSGVLGQTFYVTLFTRIMIFALAALGLNLILGYGGMVSFGHAMYIGIGPYPVGIPTRPGVRNGWAHPGVALAVGRHVRVGFRH